MAANAVAGDMGPMEFGILGPLRVAMSGRVVPLGGPRQRAVLALLVLEANRAVSMDRLAEEVWGGRPPQGWVTTLQTYVFHLRRALEPDRLPGIAGGVLVTSGRGYLLRVDRDHLDAALFQDGFTAGRAALEDGRPAEAAETLRQALDLWRGSVLADLADYAFTRPEAARLEELRLAAMEARIDADLALGRHDGLTSELNQLVADYPLRERLHGQLMVALYRCGRQAEALAGFQRVRELLADELGIDPGEPLRRIHGAVLAQDPALDWRGERTATGGDAGSGIAVARPGPVARQPIADRLGPVVSRRRARRLLSVGSAFALVAAVCIFVVARPWAAAPTGLPVGSVGQFDLSGGRVGGPVSVGGPGGLAYGDGAVWAVSSTSETVSRIDPVTHAVVPITVGSAPTAVTLTADNAWVANSRDGTVSMIDTAASEVVRTVQVGSLPVAIASGPSGVWVADEGDDTVKRIDPGTGTVTGTVPVGGRPDGIAVGPGAVWVANGEDGTVQRIDPATLQPGGPIPVGSGPEGIAVTPAAIWVANSLDQTVSKLDPATGRVIGTVQVGDGPSTLVAARGSVWVSDEFDATLDHIDPHSDRVVRVISLGSSPQGLTAAGSGLWVAGGPFAAASHRGGTLTAAVDVSASDPVNAYDAATVSALATAYDGLVALRRSGGPAGLTLVPDLATRLPRPAEGGTTYTFTLRKGIRYSNGALVQASDFRRGMQRELSFGAAAFYYQDILGAPACTRAPASCNLTAGIVTDDMAGTVTFRLSQPDPDFLYKLALLQAVSAPPGAPMHVIRRAPFLPGTGPYMITQYGPNKSITLVRNPYFHEWSYAAQPAGHPSVIRYEPMNHSQSAQESAVIAGRADLAFVDFDDQSLAIQYPARVHPGLLMGVYGAFLNTRLPPFSNLQARQAVNYAVDRAQILQLFQFAPDQAVATCQILPAGFPAHQSYCPYTSGSLDGTWHAPDMARAEHLAERSRTTNVPVTVWVDNMPPFTAAGRYLVRLLEKLRYRARLRAVTGDAFFTAASARHSQIQIGLYAGWGADFPDPSTFFGPLLSCQSALSSDTGNWAHFCDPHLDKLASKAQVSELTNLATARALWAQADGLATDQAPLIPLFDDSGAVLVSARVRNYQGSPQYGPLVDQMWVR